MGEDKERTGEANPRSFLALEIEFLVNEVNTTTRRRQQLEHEPGDAERAEQRIVPREKGKRARICDFDEATHVALKLLGHVIY